MSPSRKNNVRVLFSDAEKEMLIVLSAHRVLPQSIILRGLVRCLYSLDIKGERMGDFFGLARSGDPVCLTPVGQSDYRPTPLTPEERARIQDEPCVDCGQHAPTVTAMGEMLKRLEFAAGGGNDCYICDGHTTHEQDCTLKLLMDRAGLRGE